MSSGGSTVITANYGRFRRRMTVLVVALVVLLIGGGIGLAVVLGTDDSTANDAVPDAELPELGPVDPVLAALGTAAPVPDADVLAERLTPLVTGSALGAGATAQVIDVATGDMPFEQRADAPGTPASAARSWLTRSPSACPA